MHTDDMNDLVLMGLARDAADSEAKALRRDYSLMQIDRNNLRSLLDATEAKVDELHDKLEDAQSEAKALRARVQELEAALHGVMIGGNHLGLIIGAEHPAFTEDHEAALRHYGAGAQYEAWCCWKAIMQARAALQKQDGE